MRAEIKDGLKVVGAIAGCLILAFTLITLIPVASRAKPQETPSPQVPEGRLIGKLPDGTRVYRFEGEETLVPLTIVITPQGQIALR